MICLVTTMHKPGAAADVLLITQVELLQAEPDTTGEGQYLVGMDVIGTDVNLNKLVNDYEHLGVSLKDEEGVKSLIINFDSASEDTHVRKIDAEDWKPKTRPALMRAATATNLFNN